MKTDKDLPAQSDYSSYKPYFLLSAIGLLIFFTVTFTFSFKDKVFRAFFERPFSFAQGTEDIPTVDLIAGADNTFRRRVMNIDTNKLNILLKWKTTKSPTRCRGRFWSNVKKTDAWTGEKDVNGGEYTISEDLPAGVYVYSINCSNEFGDATGSSMTFNVGAKPSYIMPHLTSFQASTDNRPYDLTKTNQVSLNTKIEMNWSGLNMTSLYTMCVANGSWPTIYRNGNLEIKESFVLDQPKIYKYSLFCSNENGFDTQEISFAVR